MQRGAGSFFVTSTTDGSIFRGELDQARLDVFLPGGGDGRTTAIGVEVDAARDRLFVAGGMTGRIFVYGIFTGALLGPLDTGSGGFINDIAVTPDGSAYATDSLRPSLSRPPDALAAAAGGTVATAWCCAGGPSTRCRTPTSGSPRCAGRPTSPAVGWWARRPTPRSTSPPRPTWRGGACWGERAVRRPRRRPAAERAVHGQRHPSAVATTRPRRPP